MKDQKKRGYICIKIFKKCKEQLILSDNPKKVLLMKRSIAKLKGRKKEKKSKKSGAN